LKVTLRINYHSSNAITLLLQKYQDYHLKLRSSGLLHRVDFVVGYECFKGSCCLYLQHEVAEIGEKKE